MTLPTINHIHKNIIGYVLVITIFTRALVIEIPGLGGFDPYAYTVLFLFFLFTKLNLREFRFFFIFFSLFFILNLINKIYLGYSVPLLFKQIIPIIIIYIGSYSYMKKKRIEDLFEIYAGIVSILCIIGFIQFLLYLLFQKSFNVIEAVGVIRIGEFRIARMSSLLTEPSHFGIVILPAFFFYYFTKGLRYSNTIIVGLAIVLSFSAAAYFALLVTIVLKNINLFKVRTYVTMIIVIFLGWFSYQNIDPIKFRFDDLFSYYSLDQLHYTRSATTFSIMTNAHVAIHSLKKNYLLGSGLGGHPDSYREFFESQPEMKERLQRLYGLNMKSAHSLIIRIVSELGLLGLVFFLYFFFRYKSKKSDGIYNIISIACISYFIGRMVKLGGYFEYGTFFFFYCYLLSYFQAREELKQS